MDIPFKVAFIYDELPFAQALQRALGKIVSVHPVPKIAKKEGLRSIPSVNSTVMVLDTEYVKEIPERSIEIYEWLWTIIRVQLGLLSPFICLGFEDAGSFVDDPRNLIFRVRSPEYKYLQKPFLLAELVEAGRDIQPLYDDYSREWHVRRFACIKGLMNQYIHGLGGSISARDLSKCRQYIESIGYLLQTTDWALKQELEVEIERFFLKPELELAKSVIKIVGRCL